MFAQIKAKVVSLLAIAWAALLPWLNAKLGLHMTDNHIHGNQGLCGMLLAHLWHEDVSLSKIKQLMAAAGKPMAAAVLGLLGVGLAGCTVTPGEIQATTALFVGSGLTVATIADAKAKDKISADCRVIATAVNAMIPSFWPAATSAQFLNHTVDTTLLLLKSKLAASPNGTMIVDLITAAKVPFASVLGSTASPTQAMSPATQADALAFFNGVSTAIAQYLGDSTLMPPQPPAPAPAPAPPPPAPSPAPAPPK